MRCFYVLKKWSSAKLSLNPDLSLNKVSLNRDCTVHTVHLKEKERKKCLKNLIPIFCRLTVLIITAVDQIPLLDTTETCQYEFLQLIIGFLVVWSLSILVQSALIIVSLRGTILEDELRWHSEYLLYIKLGKLKNVQEFLWELVMKPHTIYTRSSHNANSLSAKFN